MTWKSEFSDRTMFEGWDVFDADGTLAIQRLDDPGSIFAHMPNPLFEDDDEAVQHVLREAREGSELHIEALADVHKVSYLEIAMWLASGETWRFGMNSPFADITSLYAAINEGPITKTRWRDLFVANVGYIKALRDAGFTISNARLNDAIHCNMEIGRIMRERGFPAVQTWWGNAPD